LTIIEHSFHFWVKRNQQNEFGLLPEINIYKEILMAQNYDKFLQEEYSKKGSEEIEILMNELERRKQETTSSKISELS
jgi:hypothetical protein